MTRTTGAQIEAKRCLLAQARAVGGHGGKLGHHAPVAPYKAVRRNMK